MIRPLRLFTTSCLSMLVTSMIFSIRADILEPISAEYHLSNEMIGLTMSSVFRGFTLGIVLCAAIVDWLGLKTLHVASGIGYLAGIALILIAPVRNDDQAISSLFGQSSTAVLYAGFLLTGISQGVVEGVTNPLVGTLYRTDKRRMFSKLHSWWPAGLIVGGLSAWALSLMGFGWQTKLIIVAIPVGVYLFMALTQQYPATERVEAKITTAQMYREALQPLFLVLFGLMWLTAATELGPDQWFSKIMADLVPALGKNAILFLVYTAGLMFLLRQFASGALRKFSPFAVLAVSALLTMCGLLTLGALSPHSANATLIALLGATLFGVGKTFFWPTMIAVTSELFPKGGALLVNLIGGAGMLSVMVSLPLIGRIIDQQDASVALTRIAVLPAFLLVAFAMLWAVQRRRGGYKPQVLLEEH